MSRYDDLDRETLVRLLQRRDVIGALGEMKIVNELTGQHTHRVFVHQPYLGILSEGAQPL